MMPETIYEMSKRMCTSTSCGNCPLRRVKSKACLISLIEEYKVEKVAEQLEVLYEWAKEHPVKTYKDVFLEKFPNARMAKHEEPLACRDAVFGIVRNCAMNCADCWNEPYKE